LVPRIAVVIPALNEAGNSPHVLGDIPAGVTTIVVDNGSTDDTAQVAAECGAVVLHERQKGYGSAVQAGLRYLEHHPHDIVVILDADHADDPSLMPRLTDPIANDEADFVLANRTLTADSGALEPAQRAGNWLATRLMKLATGYRYQDMGPFRAMRWSSLQALRMEDPTWGWNVEMQMKAVHHGLRSREVSLPYRKRRSGRSKISGSVRGTVKAGSRILWAVHRYRR
jgi:glycosyltransferase involved in cell wall biosynthesis